MTDLPMPARRSASWFGSQGRSGMIYRSWLRTAGYGPSAFDGRPVIGIATAASELSPCNAHLFDVAEAVRRGAWQAGGFPLMFPVMATGESLIRPTAMLFRNLMAMEVEELIRGNPLDGVVLLSGCDKTTPALLMGAASVDLPTISVTGGPMLNGKFRGQDIGSGTHVWKFEQERIAGTMSDADLSAAESCMSRSRGHCMTMGTASTMACVTEALGLQLPGSASWPAVDSRRYETAERAGQRIVDMVKDDLRPSDILTRSAFENAIKVNAAIGGSTNAILHLLALAGRAEVELSLDDFDQLAHDIPLLVNLMPNGDYLMEDFCYAGGLEAVIRELVDAQLLAGDAVTVTGRSLGENVSTAQCWNRNVISTVAEPIQPAGSGTAVLKGNLAPDGCVIKVSAASPKLLKHRGPALVFDDVEDYHAVLDDETLDIDADTVLIIRGAGPKGYPGMPEVSNVPLPAKLIRAGVTDLVRICDGRMSGTSYGTVLLHVSPESQIGGPIALARTGDMINLDVDRRLIEIEVSDEELQRRRSAWTAPAAKASSGYAWLYTRHVMQAQHGADFDFLTGRRGYAVPRDSH